MKAVAELWTGYADAITAGLRDTIVTDAAGVSVAPQEGFAQWVAMTHAVQQRDGQLFSIGKGGASSDPALLVRSVPGSPRPGRRVIGARAYGSRLGGCLL